MDNLVRRLFSKATTLWQRRALTIVVFPYMILSHVAYGLRVAWGTFKADVKGAWNVQ